MKDYNHTPITLTIAGSDSGGGAGIQADIKAISATGGYACSVITALTAQNTQGVSGIFPVPADFVAAQLDAVFSDLDVVAVKIGMLNDSGIIRTIAAKLREYRPEFVVLDPVMVATSGDRLLEPEAKQTLMDELVPLADILTPNLPEAAEMFDYPVPQSDEEMLAMTGKIQTFLHACSAQSQKQRLLLLKGGHLETSQQSTDLLITPNSVSSMTASRIDTVNTHGTGCTLSAAIASYLAQGEGLNSACKLAKHYLTDALLHANELFVGQGHGPVNHFYNLPRH